MLIHYNWRLIKNFYLNETLGNVVDKRDFINGKTAILQFAGFDIPQKWLGSSIPFQVEHKHQEIKIGAIRYDDYYGATTNIGANLIVSEVWLNSHNANCWNGDYIYCFSIHELYENTIYNTIFRHYHKLTTQ